MSQFQAGSPKPPGSGRKRGTPNRRTSELKQALELHGVDLIAQLSSLLPEVSAEKRADILLNLMAYVFPKRKALDSNESSVVPIAQVTVTIPSNGREAPKAENPFYRR